ncbi:MAG: hypothetical protein ABIH41_00115, partial [Nanoarchaeota archaeon]
DLAISPIRRSVNSAFDYAVREARRGLRRTYHESTIQQARSEDRAEVEERNYATLIKDVERRRKQMQQSLNRFEKRTNLAITANAKRIGELQRSILSQRAGRVIKKYVGGKKLAVSTRQAEMWRRRIEALQRKNKALYQGLLRRRKEFKKKGEAMELVAFRRSQRAVKKKTLRCGKKDIIIHATILLVATRPGRV